MSLRPTWCKPSFRQSAYWQDGHSWRCFRARYKWPAKVINGDAREHWERLRTSKKIRSSFWISRGRPGKTHPSIHFICNHGQAQLCSGFQDLRSCYRGPSKKCIEMCGWIRLSVFLKQDTSARCSRGKTVPQGFEGLLISKPQVLSSWGIIGFFLQWQVKF